jgi:hypothetical protein
MESTHDTRSPSALPESPGLVLGKTCSRVLLPRHTMPPSDSTLSTHSLLLPKTLVLTFFTVAEDDTWTCRPLRWLQFFTCPNTYKYIVSSHFLSSRFYLPENLLLILLTWYIPIWQLSFMLWVRNKKNTLLTWLILKYVILFMTFY